MKPTAKPPPSSLINTKCCRIVIRNVAFDASVDQIREHWGQFGGLVDVNLLQNSNGESRGIAFVEYKKRRHAEKAIATSNGKPFFKRKVAVDFALGKDVYEKKLKNGLIKREKFGKTTQASDVEVKDEVKEEDIKSEEESASEADEDDDDEEADRPKQARSSDVDEGLTVFVQRIPFEVTEKEFKAKMQQFGQLYYAVICREPISGHSKGNGFVKFKAKESVDLCLQSNGKVQMGTDNLDFTIAISRKDIRHNHEAKKTVSDSRNLYLLKEGLIVAGTKAAEGVSASDMAIRLRLEQVKTQMLKNLNRFISRDRLTIHNLPDACDDKKLRQMVEKHTNAKPLECRVMRENMPSPGQPKGKSKNFGFLSFRRHEDALDVLRKLNNNPTVFHKNRRPIVSFSLEDKKVHNIRQKRQEKSKLKNPTYQEKLAKLKLKRAERKARRKKQNDDMPFTPVAPPIAVANAKIKAKKQKQRDKVHTDGPDFLGMEAKSGAVVSLRSKNKLTKQSKLHAQTILKDKRMAQKEVDRQRILAEHKQKDHQRPKRKLDADKDDNFANIVNKYKDMLAGSEATTNGTGAKKRKKWFAE
jgi:nucleolar protein 4